VAGFSSGILAVNRASAASTAGALADKQMESYRQGSFTSVPVGLLTPPPPAPAGYSMQVKGDWTCVDGTPSAPPPATCSGPPVSRPVKLVTITVSDPDTARVLFSESSTFDASTG
jgi:hypothetical protein